MVPEEGTEIPNIFNMNNEQIARSHKYDTQTKTAIYSKPDVYAEKIM